VTTRPPWHHYVWLNGIYFGFSFLWNSMHTIILPLLLLSYGPEHSKNTRLGVLTFFGLLVAAIVQPVAGALSDMTTSRLGRRGPWLICGVIAAVVALAGIAWADRLWVLAGAYLMLQVATNVALGPSNGLIPDIVSEAGRGVASGSKNLIEMSGMILAALVTGALMGGDRPQTGLNLGLIAAILMGATLVTVVGLRRRAAGCNAPFGRRRRGFAYLKELLRPRLRDHPGFARLLWVRFWLILATYVVQVFGLYYLRDVLEMPDPAAAMGSLMVSIGVSLTVVSVPAGMLSERVGRRPLVVAGCGLVALSVTVLLVMPAHLGLLRLLGVVTGLGMGAFMSVNWAWATDLVPASAAGKYMGLANVASATASALSRSLGPAIDALNRWQVHAGYSAMLILAALAALVALLVAVRVPETRRVAAARVPGAAGR